MLEISHRIALASLFLAACGGVSGSVSVGVSSEPAGASCASGGERIDVKSGHASSTSYVCNGATAAAVTVVDEPAGAHCPAGGKAITSTSDGSSVTSYVCNGQSTTLVATAEPPGTHCVEGGVAINDGTTTSYICNGTQGRTVTVMNEPPGANCVSGGVVVQSDDNGVPVYLCNGSELAFTTISESTTAAPNTAYVSNAASKIALALPVSSALNVGDEIKLLVHGEGLVDLLLNQGQSLQSGDALAKVFHDTSLAATYVNGIVSSTDGLKLAAGSSTGIFTSADQGVTWTQRTSAYARVASSLDGSRLYAAQNDGIYLSSSAGVTFALSSAPAQSWAQVATSADGTRAFAVGFGGAIVSSDSGTTWAPVSVPFSSLDAVSMSADGLKIIVLGSDGGFDTPFIAVSSDGGATFAQAGPVAFGGGFGIVLSADGTHAIATTGMGSSYLSTDGGATWNPTPVAIAGAVAASSDFSRVVAVNRAGDVVLSSDGGATFSPSVDGGVASALTISGDGKTVLVAHQTGASRTVYDGFYDADPSASVDLVYVGDDTFFLQGLVGHLEDAR